MKAAKVFWRQKMGEAWFRAEADYQDHPSEVTGNCKEGGSHREEVRAGYIKGHRQICAATQDQPLGGRCGVGHAHLSTQRKSYVGGGVSGQPQEIVRGVKNKGQSRGKVKSVNTR